MAHPIKVLGQQLTSIARAAQRRLSAFNRDADRIAYIDDATDRIDLELRIRKLDQPRRTMPFHPGTFPPW